ncbi:GGDEF domain-containing protein [Roseateles sp. DAIF2]|uniref:sensor domain-containing diguanylate cyclase n=1 Tax=Roseateles sp. DAIF2 TaxID=2714952 RepID=UPI0018A3066E|nr:sensor domain-containing diguanylate cyclase [Roseateles sp. DAIF2]QPF72114.1 GGDEF domain-containing protein [Roseateles sp. DAIF2]
MQIRTKLALHLAVQIVWVALLVLALLHLAVSYRTLEQAQARQREAQRLVVEFYQSADALSLMARLFVLRHEARYARHYEEIANIREGLAERPLDYDPGYWQLRLAEPADAAASRPLGEARALLLRLRDLGLTEAEQALLEEGRRQSETLMAVERRAMVLAEARSGPAWREALELVHGEAYLRGRAALIRPMQRMLRDLEARLHRDHAEGRAGMERAAWLAGGAVLLLTLQALLSAWSFDRSVRQPLAVLRAWAQSVRAGRHDSRTRLKGDNEFGELSGVIDEMAESVERSLAGLREEVQRRTRAEEVVQHLANHDALTGLPSLRLLHDRLDRALARAEREKEGLAVLFIDLNGFKPVNDRYGHESGDMVLKVVGQRLASALRESDTVGRVGGDEFVALLVDVAGREAAEQVRAKLELLVRQPIYLPVPKVVVQISAAMGVALYPETARDAAGLLRLADQDMYKRKAAQKAMAPPAPPPVELGGGGPPPG